MRRIADEIDARVGQDAGWQRGQHALRHLHLIGLRRTCGFDIWHVAEEIGLCYPPSWFDRVSELEDAGWIQFDGKFLKLTSSGWLLANGVTEELLWPTLLSISAAIP